MAGEKDAILLNETTKRLFFLGFGNVNRALAKMLLDPTKAALFADHGGFKIVGVATGSHGLIGVTDDVSSLSLPSMLDLANEGGDMTDCAFADYHCKGPPQNLKLGIRIAGEVKLNDIADAIRQTRPDIVLEAIPLNKHSGEPASTLLSVALESGAHAVSANKGPVVHNREKILSLAASRGLSYRHESAVMDGVPIFSFWERVVPGAKLLKLEGVLNSTTNIILSRMECENESFDEALSYAQREGIAEADPSDDIDGVDAAFKLVALCNVLMEQKIKVSSVPREGIRKISQEDVRRATTRGKRYRLICSAERLSDGNSVDAKVELREVDFESPFANLQGASSALTLVTDVLGPITITSTHPTNTDTAYGLFSDSLLALQDAKLRFGRSKR